MEIYVLIMLMNKVNLRKSNEILFTKYSKKYKKWSLFVEKNGCNSHMHETNCVQDCSCLTLFLSLNTIREDQL